MVNESREDYLRTIYVLQEGADSRGIKLVDISAALNVSKPSVSEMVRKLSRAGYVKAKPYSPVFFTKKGLAKARRITHNHRVIEVFLRDILKCNLSKVHDYANRLEHAFPEEVLDRLDKFLKNPKLSPYGRLIPHNRNGS